MNYPQFSSFGHYRGLQARHRSARFLFQFRFIWTRPCDCGPWAYMPPSSLAPRNQNQHLDWLTFSASYGKHEIWPCRHWKQLSVCFSQALESLDQPWSFVWCLKSVVCLSVFFIFLLMSLQYTFVWCLKSMSVGLLFLFFFLFLF